ncbi:hypothetical protein HK405_009783 [Cladochytrium tenue]|nr:hypothetical protein HK405_009783 [Cladochytrium tenue]
MTTPPSSVGSRIAGQTSIPLVQVASSQSLNSQNPITCSGTVVIVDGCTFKVVDFVFINALETYWYAGIVGLSSNGSVSVNQEGVHFVTNPVSASASGNVTFNLITEADIAYSFFSINELRLFDYTEQELLCTAELPYQNPKASSIAGGVSATAGGSVAATTSSKATTGGTAPAPSHSAAGVVFGLVSAAFVGFAVLLI